MTESLSDILLTQTLNYGPPLVGLILFLGALGLPVGGSIMVIAAGAFSRQGFFSWLDASFYGLAGSVLGDTLSFGMGLFAKDWTQRKFGHLAAWKSATETFNQRGGMAIYLTRFLITALAIPTNLIAGGSGYKFRNFMAVDIAGELTWLALYGGLGYLFGSEWELVSQFISDFGGALLGVVILIVGIYMSLKTRKATA
jgi:membrane protein DedA with SNARE-associated domain